MASGTPIPLHLLTGFLGSGKTTLLAALLNGGVAERLAVLVNELGELALDHWLLERVDEDVLTLASGCVCCSLRDDLYATVERIAASHPTRIVVETTGLADPAPILHGLATDPRLAAIVRPAGVVAVVDALRAEDLLASHPEARRQLECADRVVLTKCDLAPQRVEGVRDLIAAFAPGCDVRVAVEGFVDPDWLFGAPALGRITDPSSARNWLHHHGGAQGGAPRTATTHALTLDAPADLEVVGLWLRLVTQFDAARLLRIKGIVEDRASGEVWALQAAGRTVSPPRRLLTQPGLRGVRFVVVARDLDPLAANRLIDSLRSAAGAPSLADVPGAGGGGGRSR